MADALTADQAKELGLDDGPPEAQPLPPDKAKALGLEDDAPEDTRGTTAYLGASDKKSPAQASEVIKHAQDIGMSTDAAEAVLPDLKHEHDTNVLGGLMQAAPPVESFIQDPAKAAFVKDEPGIFAALHWGLSGHTEIPKSLFDKLDAGQMPGLSDLPTWHAPFWAEAFKDSWVENTKLRYLQTKNALGLADDQDRANLKQLQAQYEEKDYGATGAFSKTVVSASKAIGYATGELSAAALAGGVATALAPEEGAVAVGAGATIGAKFLWNYFQAYGPSYEKFKALGATDEDARQRASIVARDTSLIFAAAGGFASKIPGLNRIITSSGADALSEQLAKKTAAKTVTDFVADHGAAALNGAGMLTAAKVSEVLQENDLKSQQGKPTDWRSSADELAATYWDGLKTMFVAGAIPGVPVLLHDVARAHYLADDARKLEVLHSAAEQSKTVQNHANEAQEYMRLAQSDGPVNYHADIEGWNQYWQSKQVEPAEAAAKVMGDGGKAYAEAQMTGGDLRIPAERYLMGFAKTEHLRGLEDIVRLNQDGLSLGQVRMLDESVPKADGDGSDEIEKDFAEKAKAAGTPDKVAEGQAKIISAAFRTFAAKLNTGETAHDLYQSFPLAIRGPGQEPVSQKDAEAFISQGYSQGAARPDVTDASSQLAARAADAAHDRGAESYLDPVTGLRNARAFDESKVPEGKAVAVITSPSIKGINDHVEHGGHDVANSVLSSAGAPLHGVDEGAARSGTNFRVLVDADKADEQLKAAIEKVKAHLGNDNIDVIGATGKNSEEAFANLRKETDRRRLLGPEDAEHIPAKGKLRPGLDVSELKVPEGKAKATVPPELAAKAKALTPKEYFEKIYLDHAWRTDADGKRVSEATGLLSGDGFRARPQKANTLSMDMVGLGKIPMGAGDSMLHAFARAAVLAGGEHVDAAHLSGDEFVAQHDDPAILHAYADRLRDKLEGMKIRYVDPETGKTEAAPVLFRHGIGADYTEADRNLNAKRAAEGTSEVRPRGGLDEGQAAGNRVPGQADLERGRAFFDERPARPHSFPEEVASILRQSDFRLESKGGRGYITFTTGENGKPRRFNIQLLENADESTLAHESMHFLSEVMGDLAQRTDAPADLKTDYQTLLTFMGHESHSDRRAAMKERAQLAKIEDRTPEQNARLKELTGKEERATHAWEQYLAEGKSPTPELARVFARFKNWMAKIYKSVAGVAGEFQKQYGQELKLSDDVRRVFDRMLGADKAVQDASEGDIATQPMGKLEESMGPEQRLEYRRATEDAKVAAENEMVRRVASAQREENSAFMREERSRLQPEVEDELAKDPVMRTMRYLEKGDLAEDPGETPAFLRGPDGGPQLLNRPTVKAEYGQEVVDSLPSWMFAKGRNGGLPADELALRLGWNSGAAMLDEVSTAPKYSDEVRKGVEAKMKDLYGGQLLDTPQQLASEAIAALRGPKAMGKALLELQHLRSLLDKNAAPRANTLTIETARDTARRLIATKTVGQLTRGDQGLAGYYSRAEKSAAKRSFDALDKGNLAKAYAEKSAQLLNMALAREAEGKREMLEKAFKRIVHTPDDAWKGADPSIRDAHDAILEAAGLKAPMAGLPPPSLEPFLAKAAASGAELAFDPDAIREFVDAPKDWGNLTPDDAEDIRDAVLNLRHLAAVQNEYTIEGQKMAREVYFLRMESAISKRPSQPSRPRDASKEAVLARARRTVQSIDAKLMTPDTIFALMDAHEENGPVRQALETPFLEARDKKRALMQEVTGKIVDAWENLPKEVRDSKDDEIDISKELPLPPDLVDKGLGDGPVTRKYLWMIALNMGNEGNKQRLLDGYQWSERAVMNVLDKHMSKAEWEMVQKTWDTLEGLYPHLAALHERETGVRLPKVEATPIQTRHGTFEGGYFPARKENRVESGKVRQDIENVADIFGENYQRATVESGHRKSRVENAKYYINLNWSVVPSHIAQVVHDIAYREAVKQAARIVFDPEFRDLTNRYMGQEYGKDILPWLKAVANESADSVPANMGAIQGAIGWVRGRAMRTQLGGNLASMSQHFTDPAIGVAAGVTTARDTAMATVRAASLAGFPSMRAFALEHSSELKARSDHLTRELDRKMKEIGRNEPGAVRKGLETTAHLAQETMGVFHDSMDKLVSTITWTAGYTEAVRKAKDAGLTDAEAHAKATKSADAAVRKIYPSHELAQQSEAIRSKTFLGGSLMFAGFANKVWNLRRQSIDKAYLTFHDGEAGFSAKASAVAKVAGTFMALAAIGTTNKLLRGQGKKDDEETPEWLEKTMLAEPFNDTPLLAPLAESASSMAVTGKAQKPSFRNAPALEFLSEIYDKATKTHRDEDLDEHQKFMRYLGTLSTVLFAGSGATQIHRTLDYVEKLHTGEADPRGPLDVAGGLYYGQRKGNPANPFTSAQTAISGE